MHNASIDRASLDNRIMIESFLAVISYWTTGHDLARVFNEVIARSKVDNQSITMLGAMCVRVNISAASVYDVKTHIKSKLHEKNAKFTV